jgi:hypothetical protein
MLGEFQGGYSLFLNVESPQRVGFRRFNYPSGSWILFSMGHQEIWKNHEHYASKDGCDSISLINRQYTHIYR